MPNGPKNFLAIPKELSPTRITTPADWNNFTDRQKKEHPMKYSYWVDAERICTVSEPFLTPVIQHVLSTIGGIGVPDYPEQMKTVLKNVLADFSTAPAVAPAPAPPAAAIATPQQPTAEVATSLASTQPAAPPAPEPPPPVREAAQNLTQTGSQPRSTESTSGPAVGGEPPKAAG